jgi:D-lactate dehydrogenase (cytochrome)
MRFNSINDKDLTFFNSLVDTERFSTGDSNLDLHSRDMSRHRNARPEAVIWPVSQIEVIEIVKYANQRSIPVTGWGAGSSLEGNPIPLHGGIVLNFSQMNRILNIRADDFQADVEPGVIYQDLNHQLRHTGLFFPPDPGARATIGGMIANNASGTRTVRYGSTRDHILRLVMVLANGEVIEIGSRASKSSSGYNLVSLFVGSEGMLGIIVEATVRLIGISEAFASAVATFPSVDAASRAVFQIMRCGIDPAALELLAAECTDLINAETDLGLSSLPTLFMEFHGPTKNQLADVTRIARDICLDEQCNDFRPGLEKSERDRLMDARHRLGEMIRHHHPGHVRIVIDVAVPISAYPAMIRFARAQARRIDTAMAYTFGHAGDGNIHLVIGAEPEDKPAWSRIQQANIEIVDKALELGGTATGEHGVGIGKMKFMHAEHGRSLDWMRSIKGLFDPKGILNPGKMFQSQPSSDS